MTSLEWIERTHDTATLAGVREYLEGLAERLAAEASDAKGKERWRLEGEARGIETALAALAALGNIG